MKHTRKQSSKSPQHEKAFQSISKHHKKAENVHEKRNECWTKCTEGQRLFGFVGQLITSCFSSLFCWSKCARISDMLVSRASPPKHSSPSMQCTCTACNRRQISKTTVMTATAKSHQRDGYRRRHSVATGARSHLPPASRCASVPLSASISRSCSFPAPSRP